MVSDRDDHPPLPMDRSGGPRSVKQWPEQLLGKLAGLSCRFPLLLKFLEDRDTLSVRRIPSSLFFPLTIRPRTPCELQKDGFDMKKLSIVGKDYHTDEHVVGYYNTGDRMMYWGKLGAFWGGFWGLLFGSAFFWVPGIGPLVVAGPLVPWIVAALEGAVVTGSLSALGADCTASGFPRTAS